MSSSQQRELQKEVRVSLFPNESKIKRSLTDGFLLVVNYMISMLHLSPNLSLRVCILSYQHNTVPHNPRKQKSTRLCKQKQY
jgi:hypothetical protein